MVAEQPRRSSALDPIGIPNGRRRRRRGRCPRETRRGIRGWLASGRAMSLLAALAHYLAIITVCARVGRCCFAMISERQCSAADGAMRATGASWARSCRAIIIQISCSLDGSLRARMRPDRSDAKHTGARLARRMLAVCAHRQSTRRLPNPIAAPANYTTSQSVFTLGADEHSSHRWRHPTNLRQKRLIRLAGRGPQLKRKTRSSRQASAGQPTSLMARGSTKAAHPLK